MFNNAKPNPTLQLTAAIAAATELCVSYLKFFLATQLKTMKCINIACLKAYFSGFHHQYDMKPNGQNMYTFPSGLVINVYETGSVVMQGVTNTPFATNVVALINVINTPVQP